MKTIRLEKFLETDIQVNQKPNKILGELITENTEVYSPTGELILKYIQAPMEIRKLAREIALEAKITKSARTNKGTMNKSAVFGVMPRIPIREDYCRFTVNCREQKETYKKVLNLNKCLCAFYKEILPVQYLNALEFVNKNICESYRVIESPWLNTSINMNQIISFHIDKGNVATDFSNILIIKNACEGGELVIPQLGITLEQADGYLTFFHGTKFIHGVMPAKFYTQNSYRASIVHYTLNGVKNCLPPKEELKRLNIVKTKQASNKLSKLNQLRTILNKKRAKQPKS